MHYVNQTYNEFIARQLYCRTGFHYVVDTSRNGGRFSRQALPKVLKCIYDPPDVKQVKLSNNFWQGYLVTKGKKVREHSYRCDKMYDTCML